MISSYTESIPVSFFCCCENPKSGSACNGLDKVSSFVVHRECDFFSLARIVKFTNDSI